MKNNRFGGLIVGLLVMLLIVPVSQAAAEPEPNQPIMVDTDSKNTYLKMGFAVLLTMIIMVWLMWRVVCMGYLYTLTGIHILQFQIP